MVKKRALKHALSKKVKCETSRSTDSVVAETRRNNRGNGSVDLAYNDKAIKEIVKRENGEVEFENVEPKVEIDTDLYDICYTAHDAVTHNRLHDSVKDIGGHDAVTDIGNIHTIKSKYKFGSFIELGAASDKEKLAEYKRKLGIPESRTQCPRCFETFKNLKTTRLHMTEVHGDKNYHCGPCDKWFSAGHMFDSHLRVHLDIRPYKCDLCDKSFTAGKYLSKHKLCHAAESEREFSCSYCSKRFIRKKHLESHIRMHTNERPFSCSICGKTYKQMAQLVIHNRLHTGERFYCYHCNKGFTAKCDMEKHQIVHFDQKPYKCDTCGSSFKRKGSLNMHVLVHFDASQLDTQKCSICGSLFSCKNYLKSHMEIHKENKPSFSCESCGGVFTRKSGLRSHRKAACKALEHPEWPCDFCGKRLKSEDNLRKHRKYHTHGYKYPCKKCDKSYPTNGLLARHMREFHVKEEKKNCKICMFKTSNMTAHLRHYHFKKQISQCATCGKIFQFEAQRYHHELIHLVIKPYRCDTCQKTFAQKVNMKRHIAVAHLDLPRRPRKYQRRSKHVK